MLDAGTGLVVGGVAFLFPGREFGLAGFVAVRDDQAGAPVAAVRDHRGAADSILRAGQLPCPEVVAVARQWLPNRGRVGWTPVVRVRGRGSGRVSMAGMDCFKPGRRSRLVYAIREYRGCKDELKGFGWRDFRDLVVRARIQLGGPIVLV